MVSNSQGCVLYRFPDAFNFSALLVAVAANVLVCLEA